MTLAEMEGIFDEKIHSYRENDSMCNSPIWIWVSKIDSENIICNICKRVMHLSGISRSTGNFLHHLRRHHGANSDYNAWIICEELAELRAHRMANKKQKLRKVSKKRDAKQKIKKAILLEYSKRIKEGEEDPLSEHDIREIFKDIYDDQADDAEAEEADEPSSQNFSIDTGDLSGSELGGHLDDDAMDDTTEDAEQLSRETAVVKRECDSPSSPTTKTSTPATLTGLGIPRAATLSTSNAPVHVDVGGTHYTTSLDTLNKFPESRLSKMFNGSAPIVLDTTNNRYFIDRDGRFFSHVLNFCRTSRLNLPDNFQEFDQLYEEACFYEIPALVAAIQRQMHLKGLPIPDLSTDSTLSSQRMKNDYECVTVHVFPVASGEQLTISAKKEVLMEAFPELTAALIDGRNATWTIREQLMKFPISEISDVTSLEVIRRMMQIRFNVTASSGGGVEGQQTFTEYLLARKVSPRLS